VKPLTHNVGKPKDVFMVRDQDGTILRIVSTINLAMKHKPKHGSIVISTPNALNRYFGDDEIVREFIEKEVICGRRC